MQLLQNDLSIKISIPSAVNMNTYLFIIFSIEITQRWINPNNQWYKNIYSNIFFYEDSWES